MPATARLVACVILATASMAAPAVANPKSQDPTAAPKGEYELDRRHASLIVKIPHMGGFSKFTLRFDKLEGGFAYDPAAWRDTKLTLAIDPNSVDTGLGSFDKTIAG